MQLHAPDPACGPALGDSSSLRPDVFDTQAEGELFSSNEVKQIGLSNMTWRLDLACVATPSRTLVYKWATGSWGRGYGGAWSVAEFVAGRIHVSGRRASKDCATALITMALGHSTVGPPLPSTTIGPPPLPPGSHHCNHHSHKFQSSRSPAVWIQLGAWNEFDIPGIDDLKCSFAIFRVHELKF